MIISPLIQGSLQLLNISKRKAEASSSSLSPCSCNLASKRRWEGPDAIAVLALMSEMALKVD
jgi:hypothetical protein